MLTRRSLTIVLAFAILNMAFLFTEAGIAQSTQCAGSICLFPLQCGGANLQLGASGYMNLCSPVKGACTFCDGNANITPCTPNNQARVCCCNNVPTPCGQAWNGTCKTIFVGKFGVGKNMNFCVKNNPAVKGGNCNTFKDCDSDIPKGGNCPKGTGPC